MTLRKVACPVTPAAVGQRLDQFLAAALDEAKLDEAGGMSRRRVRRLIDAGAVYLDGRRVRIASRRLRAGEVAEVVIDAAPAPAAAFDPARVLFEDDVLVAVDKPSGLPTQATVDDAVHHLEAEVRRWLCARDGETPYLALHHRLDRGTSGVVLLAKSRTVNVALASAFAGRRVVKVYHALTEAEREVPDAWRVEDRLAKSRGEDGVARVAAVEEGGRPAATEMRILERLPRALLVEARPLTGRTHQIRVHLAGSAGAVLGDRLYGSATGRAPRLMLHADRLELDHPIDGRRLVLESPWPDDFRETLARERAQEGVVKGEGTPGDESPGYQGRRLKPASGSPLRGRLS